MTDVSARPTSCTVLQSRAELADPHVVSDIRDRRSIIDAVFDGLVRRGADGRFMPWLAERWSAAPDCRHWEFELRAGVRCHDGGPLDAHDAAASVRRALDPWLPGELGTQGVLRSYLEGTLVDVPDAGTLRLVTPTPVADLLDFLVDLPVVPERAFDLLGTGQAIGSGAFRVAEAVPGRVALDAFADHWAGRPRAGQIVWEAEPDAARRLARFRAGEADWVVDPPRAEVLEDAHLVRAPSFLCVIFLFNIFQGPTTDPRVRGALHHALDVDELIRDPAIMAGTADRLAGPITARHMGGAGAALPCAFDPGRAASLLAEAGHAGGLDLSMDLPARFPDESIPLARAIARQWERVGVRCSLRVHEDRPGYAERVRTKNIGDLCCFDSSPVSTYRVFCEKLDDRRRGPWWMGYRNPELNDVLDAAASEPDGNKRANCFSRALDLTQADAPWLFLYAPDSLWLRKAEASPMAPSPEGRLRPLLA